MGNACACCGRFEVSIKKQIVSAEILYNAYQQLHGSYQELQTTWSSISTELAKIETQNPLLVVGELVCNAIGDPFGIVPQDVIEVLSQLGPFLHHIIAFADSLNAFAHTSAIEYRKVTGKKVDPSKTKQAHMPHVAPGLEADLKNWIEQTYIVKEWEELKKLIVLARFCQDHARELEGIMTSLGSGFSKIETLFHQEVQLGEEVGMSVAQLAAAALAGGPASPSLYTTAGVLIENIFCLIQNTVETVKLAETLDAAALLVSKLCVKLDQEQKESLYKLMMRKTTRLDARGKTRTTN